MSLSNILIFIGLALVSASLLKGSGRKPLLLIISILAIYWLQPATPIRNLDFWLPTLTIAISVFTWAYTRQEKGAVSKADQKTALLITSVILLISLTRYFFPLCCLTVTRPPEIFQIIVLIMLVVIITQTINHWISGNKNLIQTAVIKIIVLFIFLKTEVLALWLSTVLRNFTGQSVELATAFDIRWLGFSYVAFRLLHTLRDRMNNRLPETSLSNFITFIIFFPALTAGPIDKIQRFGKDLDDDFILNPNQILLAGKRIVIGIFMKFAIADSLAIFALNSTNHLETQSTIWMWVLTYAYAFRIFFDFAGYTQIAIGLGMLFGIQLPENFDQPYRKSNLTAFWNSWHMTLAQWFRGYFFNPLTRALRSRKVSIPVIILFGQLGTMVLLGLWHGITWNFVIWGLWHGIGLFIHNRWVEFTKSRPLISNQKVAESLGVLLTFHFVVLGWVWFALPDPSDAIHTFQVLFGGGA
ncbi:MAG: hypothetical protein HON98_10625 [Chloroflexi bacterium]|jgi:alginate O-acetyltransferase complex protein AlgI|nr:hypothetical protein [Chloroflexota bacterium]MBT3670675.1 hypothetical protein [Chloroflexota bacterium]MBT4002666.1 hypothetical protein [Chloroflexota bacterium]MBT4306289.1 hypothetical protein [Chloroflexota bacterium]MBT4532830.1 hypothetical protein [Chloroflexota bacterium]